MAANPKLMRNLAPDAGLPQERGERCDCGWQPYDPWETQKATRKLNGADVLKIKLLRRRGDSRRSLAKRFGVTEAIIGYAEMGDYDDRIEEWKLGRSLSLTKRFVYCPTHTRELKALTSAKKLIRQVEKWTKKSART